MSSLGSSISVNAWSVTEDSGLDRYILLLLLFVE